MQRSTTPLLLLLPALVVLMGARGSELMYKAPPIEVPKGTALRDISRAISTALLGRGWAVDKENLSESGEASEIVSSLYIRVHLLTIRFEFDDKQIRIHYVKSTNLGYDEKKNGEQVIHPKYTQWIMNLEKDLKGELQKLRM